MSVSSSAGQLNWPGLAEPKVVTPHLLRPVDSMIRIVSNVAWGLGFGRAARGAPIAAGYAGYVGDTVRHVPDPSPDTDAMLRDLVWAPDRFEVRGHVGHGPADAVLTFPSPMPQGDRVCDDVVIEWYAARDPQGNLIDAPAMLTLDILQGENIVSRFMARAFARNGVHGFAMHMPRDGRRKPAGGRNKWSAFLHSLRQAVGDARRARDVIASLPLVNGKIGIQGTSLGGFIATLAASIDNAFEPALITLAGGDVFRVLSEGRRDAARVRQRLHQAGYDDVALREALWRTEPLRLAHRLDPDKTWLFTARRDQVVPGRFSEALAQAARIRPSHHKKFAGCHYTCVMSAPWMVAEMVRTVRGKRRRRKG